MGYKIGVLARKIRENKWDKNSKKCVESNDDKNANFGESLHSCFHPVRFYDFLQT
jgi:hypothetical protein